MLKNKKYVFLDWCGIEAGYGTKWPGYNSPLFTPSGIRLKVHKPLLEREPVFYPDKKWEQCCVNGYATFMEDEGMIRCWYECFSSPTTDDMTSYLAYAESDDGINWKKPILKIHEFNDSKENNIIMNIHGTSVLKDSDAPSTERYKLVWAEYDHEDSRGYWCKILGATSPDGISWKKIPNPILINPGDTQTVATYDNEIKKYVLYTRQKYSWYTYQPNKWERSPGGPSRRAISMSMTEDFRHWPEPQMILTNDPTDPPDWDYYTNGYTRWPGADRAHLMFIDMYHRTKDTFDVHLATSRDGKIWNRPLGQCAWIENGPAGSFNDMMIEATLGIIRSGEGQWVNYVQCNRNGHNKPPEECDIPYGGYWRALIREDGYQSLTADEFGECWTVPILFEGNILQINATVPYAGRLSVGIADKKTGVPLKGFDVDSCDPLDSCEVWKTVRWRGKEDLSEIEGKPIRIQFKFFKSDLFGFRFIQK